MKVCAVCLTSQYQTETGCQRGQREQILNVRFHGLSSLTTGLTGKNCCAPEMGLVTVFCPLTTTGAGELVVQTAGETRFVVDCKVNPAALVGHVKITYGPEGIIVSCGGRRQRKTEHRALPELPPSAVVPYRVLPDKINPAARAFTSVAAASETIQGRKTRAIGVDGEHRASPCRHHLPSHTGCCPIKSIRHPD